MAQWCLTTSGRALLPRPGGWLNQMPYEMQAMQLALKAQRLFKKGGRWEGDGNGDFLVWLNSEDTAVFLTAEYIKEMEAIADV